MSVTVYGLTRCDTCLKACKWLDRHGIAHAFIDYRDYPIAPAMLKAWARQAEGWEKLVNRASTTWGNLPTSRKSPGSEAEWLLLLREYPALIRRPVLVGNDGEFTQGFSDALYQRVFAFHLALGD